MSTKDVPQSDSVNSPKHYQGAHGLESIDVIEAFNLGFCDGNAIKYILRSGKKEKHDEDLRKAVWYLIRKLRTEYLQEVTVDSDGRVLFKDLPGGRIFTYTLRQTEDQKGTN